METVLVTIVYIASLTVFVTFGLMGFIFSTVFLVKLVDKIRGKT